MNNALDAPCCHEQKAGNPLRHRIAGNLHQRSVLPVGADRDGETCNVSSNSVALDAIGYTQRGLYNLELHTRYAWPRRLSSAIKSTVVNSARGLDNPCGAGALIRSAALALSRSAQSFPDTV